MSQTEEQYICNQCNEVFTLRTGKYDFKEKEFCVPICKEEYLYREYNREQPYPKPKKVMSKIITIKEATAPIEEEPIEKRTVLKIHDGRELKLGEIIKGRIARFYFYRQGNLYYTLRIADREYSFPIPINDLEGATVSLEEKAIILMRYIKRAFEDGTLVLTPERA